MFARLALVLLPLALAYSEPHSNQQGAVKYETEFGQFSKNVNPRVVQMFESEESADDQQAQPEDVANWSSFTKFMNLYGKVYNGKSETLKRFEIYKNNLKEIAKLKKLEKGTATYGLTQFADLTPSEFAQTYLPYVWPKNNLSSSLSADELAELDQIELPKSWDWREKNAVTPVKNQGMCGSCWAFSVTGNVEGQWALKSHKLVSLSEQELVDCDKMDKGCNGGFPPYAYKEIIRLGGLDNETKYPYVQTKEPQCMLERKDVVAYINSSVQLPKDEKKIAAYLLKHGPISIGVNALPLQFYRHGIFHPWKIICNPLMLNHGVLIVGFGQEGNKPYWIIKNSWGASFGEKGYYRLYRGKNVCGVAELATSAIIN